MGYILTQDSVNTNATINTTGTSAALISAPGAGLSLRIRHISWVYNTTTANRISFSFLPSGGANSFIRSGLTVNDTGEINILGGWLIGANAGLYLAFSATSTPTINVSVVADVVDRSR